MYVETKKFLAVGQLDVKQTRRLDSEWQKFVAFTRRALKASKITLG